MSFIKIISIGCGFQKMTETPKNTDHAQPSRLISMAPCRAGGS
jgi:hypothetical protein